MKTEDKKPAPKKAIPGKVFDVSRPGKAAASPTSRPVIMGHKPEAQAAQTAVSGIGEASPLLTKRKIQVLPSGGPAEEPTPAAAPVPAEPEDVPAGAPSPTPAEEGALGAAAVDAISGPPALPPEKEKEPEAEPAPEAEPEKPKLVITPPSETESKEPEPAATEPTPPATTEAEAPAEETPTDETAKPEPSDAPAATPDLPSSSLASSSVPESETPVTEESAVDPLKPTDAPPYPKIDPLFDESGHIVVSHHNHHQRHALKVLGLLLLIVLLAAVTLNLLLDLDLLKIEGLPHTNLL